MSRIPAPLSAWSASRLHFDVLVLGASLEGALAAALLARRGWKVGLVAAPEPSAALGDWRVQATPGLSPGLQGLPALSRVLEELGLLLEAKRLFQPAALQILGDERRLDVPADRANTPPAWGFDPLAAAAQAARALSETPPASGPLAGWRRGRTLARWNDALAAPEGLAGELVHLLCSILPDAPPFLAAALQTADAPHVLSGGVPALVTLLHRQFVSHGGTLLPVHAPARLTSAGWRSVQLALSGGGQVSARLLLFGADAKELARVLDVPEGSRLAARLARTSCVPLLRLSFAVCARGLPAALAPESLVTGPRPLLLERRPLGDGLEELSAFWRQVEGTPSAQAEDAVARLRGLLPFFERHVVARAAPAVVPGYGQPPEGRPPQLARRILEARGGVRTAPGFDGRAWRAEAMAAQAMRLVPRKNLVRGG